MSGEMSAVSVPSAEPPPVATESGRLIPISEAAASAALEREKKRQSFAPTFDRLIEANLELTVAVGRLVRVSYAALGVYAVTTGLVLWALWARK